MNYGHNADRHYKASTAACKTFNRSAKFTSTPYRADRSANYLGIRFNKAILKSSIMQTQKAYIGHLAMFGANLLWGVMTPLSKAVLQNGMVSPFSLTTLRMVGAAAAFWILSIFTRREHVPPHDLAMLFFAAMLGVTINQACFIAGVGLSSPIDASVITTTTPILTMILAALYLKEPITSKKVLGIFSSAIGALILIFSARTLSTSAGQSGIFGDLLCLTAEICFACYCVFFKDLISRYSAVTLMKWMFTYASICCIPLSYRSLAAIDFASLPLNIYADIAFVVFGATFIAYLLVPIAQQRLRPTLVTMYCYVQPTVATILAVIWSMDKFTPSKVIAIILVFGGVYLVNRSKSRAQMEAEELAASQAHSQATAQPTAIADSNTTSSSGTNTHNLNKQ